jgi:hypothetical protein
MKKIVISATKGSGPSLVKSLAVGLTKIDSEYGTCHESWQHERTQNNDEITFTTHTADLDEIQKEFNPDITIQLYINPKNLVQICQRLVIVDFMYTQDNIWAKNGWCWSQAMHDQLAGPDWPTYSINIKDYPVWVRNEICQVAYDRSLPWTVKNPGFNFVIDSDELFGNSAPVTLLECFNSINCQINFDFINQWRKKNYKIWQGYNSLFSWTPPNV